MNRFLIILILLLFFNSATHLKVYASDETGVILVVNSSDKTSEELVDKLKNYLKLLRSVNEPIFGKNIFWIKTYDYADETYVPYCIQILKVEKRQVPFAGLSKLNEDYTFREFIPGKSVSNISNAMDGAFKIMDYLKETFPSEKSGKMITRLAGIRTLKTEPAGAEVKIGDIFNGKSPAEDIIMKPGKYRVILALDDYIPVTKDISIEEQKFDDFVFKLEKINAFIDLETSPAGAPVEIDGKPAGSTPVQLKVLPGEHKITLKKQGYKTYEKSISLENNNTVKKSIRLLPDKVICYLECSGYYVKEFRKIDMHRSAEITRTIFSEALKVKIGDFISKEKEIILTEDKNHAEFLIVYEAWPEVPLRGRMNIIEIKNSKTIMEKTGKISISYKASDSACTDKAVELFGKSLFPAFREYVEKKLQYPE